MRKTKILDVPKTTDVILQHFEINVSKNGKHLFATHKRSLGTKGEALALYDLFREKFPKSKGYDCRLTGYTNQAFGIAGFGND